MPNNYMHLRHSKTLLMAHIILVIKYRRALTAKGIWQYIKRLTDNYCAKHHISIIEMESDADYLHILVRYSPSQSISRIVSGIKQYTTYYTWRQYNRYLRKLYWGERALWSDGFFACSVDNALQETVEEYIRNQG